MTITQPSLCMLVLSLEDNIRARDFISHHGTSATNNSPRSTSYLSVKTKGHKVERPIAVLRGLQQLKKRSE